MTQTFLLAEGLDILRRAELHEEEVDRTQTHLTSSSKGRSRLCSLIKAYDNVYQEYMCGVEIINYVRRSALDGSESNRHKLIEMCETKMKNYMDRCDAIIVKKDNILLPIDQLNDYVEGISFNLSKPLFTLKGSERPLTNKESFCQVEKVNDGSYFLVVKNLDDYSIAVPLVNISLCITPEVGEKQIINKILPCQCGWQRFIGVVNCATIKLMISSKGLLRQSHIDVGFYKLNNKTHTTIKKKDVEFVDGNEHKEATLQMPKINHDELEALIGTNVPSDKLPENLKQNKTKEEEEKEGGGRTKFEDSEKKSPRVLSMKIFEGKNQKQSSSCVCGVGVENIEINPAGLTCTKRLERLRRKMDTWPCENVMAADLSKEQQHFLQSVFAFPFPTEIEVSDE